MFLKKNEVISRLKFSLIKSKNRYNPQYDEEDDGKEYILNVRDYGVWDSPVGEEDYDWNELSTPSMIQFKKSLAIISSQYKVKLDYEFNEKNWLSVSFKYDTLKNIKINDRTKKLNDKQSKMRNTSIDDNIGSITQTEYKEEWADFIRRNDGRNMTSKRTESYRCLITLPSPKKGELPYIFVISKNGNGFKLGVRYYMETNGGKGYVYMRFWDTFEQCLEDAQGFIEYRKKRSSK